MKSSENVYYSTGCRLHPANDRGRLLRSYNPILGTQNSQQFKYVLNLKNSKFTSSLKQ